MICVLILSPMSLLPLSASMSLKLAPLGIVTGGAKSLAVAVLVGDVLDEQHEQDVVLVLAGIHAAAQFIAGCPEGGVEVGFLDGHELNARLRPAVSQLMNPATPFGMHRWVQYKACRREAGKIQPILSVSI